MPPDLDLVRQWLERAKADLDGAEVALAGRPLISEHACFHAQQAVEKALKAFLVYHQVEFAWTHQIGLLLELCANLDDAFTRFVTTAVPLTEYAVRFRYPFSEPPPSLEQARTAFDTARQLFQFVAGRLPEETRPAV